MRCIVLLVFGAALFATASVSAQSSSSASSSSSGSSSSSSASANCGSYSTYADCSSSTCTWCQPPMRDTSSNKSESAGSTGPCVETWRNCPNCTFTSQSSCESQLDPGSKNGDDSCEWCSSPGRCGGAKLVCGSSDDSSSGFNWKIFWYTVVLTLLFAVCLCWYLKRKFQKAFSPLLERFGRRKGGGGNLEVGPYDAESLQSEYGATDDEQQV